MDIEPPSLLVISLLNNTHIISIVILLVLLICSALISGAEVAFFSLTATDFNVKSIDNSPTRKLEIVQKLLSKPKKLLATILVANNFINIAIVLLFASLSDLLFSGINNQFYGISIRFILEVGLVTFLILLFGEILPKIYASRNKVSFSKFMAYPLKGLDTLLSPLSNPMQSAIKLIKLRFVKQKSCKS